MTPLIRAFITEISLQSNVIHNTDPCHAPESLDSYALNPREPTVPMTHVPARATTSIFHPLIEASI